VDQRGNLLPVIQRVIQLPVRQHWLQLVTLKNTSPPAPPKTMIHFLRKQSQPERIIPLFLMITINRSFFLEPKRNLRCWRGWALGPHPPTQDALQCSPVGSAKTCPAVHSQRRILAVSRPSEEGGNQTGSWPTSDCSMIPGRSTWFRDQGSGFRVQGFRLRVWGLGFGEDQSEVLHVLAPHLRSGVWVEG